MSDYDPSKNPKGRGSLMFIGVAVLLFAALFISAWWAGAL